MNPILNHQTFWTNDVNLSSPSTSMRGMNFLKNEHETSFFEKEELIFREDTTAWGLYYLRKGKVKLFKHGSEGKEQIIKIACSGEFLGYSALLHKMKYNISASTLEDTALTFIPKDIFLREFKDQGEVSSYFTHLLCQDLIEVEKKLLSQSYRPVRGRMADTLLFLHHIYQESDGKSIINLSRQDMANMLGIAKETLIRMLSEFKAEELIALEGLEISVINPHGLIRISHLYD